MSQTCSDCFFWWVFEAVAVLLMTAELW